MMEKKRKSFLRRHWGIVSAITLGLLFGGYFYIKSARTENRLQREMAKFEEDVIQTYSDQRSRMDAKVLGMMGESFMWAVRKSIMRGNMDEVEDYIFDMVKSEDILEVNVLDANEKVIASSDLKLVDKKYPKERKLKLSNSDAEVVVQDSVYLVITPINSLSNHLGHTLIRYRIQKL